MKSSAAIVVLLLLVAGCATRPEPGPAPGVAPPVLELLESAEFVIPAGCEPIGGRAYRTGFMVRADGHVSDVAPEKAAGCVGDALARWVATFRYAPLSRDVPAVVDWMAVIARR